MNFSRCAGIDPASAFKIFTKMSFATVRAINRKVLMEFSKSSGITSLGNLGDARRVFFIHPESSSVNAKNP
jgi:hypothetical protein